MRIGLFVITVVLLVPVVRDAAGQGILDRLRGLPPLAEIDRADLAETYLRVERAFFAEVPEEARLLREVNRAFDQATARFFLGLKRHAIERLDNATLRLIDATRSDRVALSVQARVEPRTVVLGAWQAGETTPRVRVRSRYEVDGRGEWSATLRFRLLDTAGEPALELPALPLSFDGDARVDATVPIPLPEDALPLGSYTLQVRAGDNGHTFPCGRVAVVAESLNTARERYAARLADLTAGLPEDLRDALTIAQARNALLKDTPDTNNSAQFLADLPAVATQVAAEIEALAEGRDPYAELTGDRWMVLPDASGQIPLRLVVPEAEGDAPLPVVLALHGMGADENMFTDAYGQGVLKRIAMDRGFILVAPRAEAFNALPDALPRLLAFLAARHAIDRERVYLIGHSMGAGFAASLAMQHREALAAVACIAGGMRFGASPEACPTLVVTGTEDGIVPSRPLQWAASRARDAGAPLTPDVREDWGHTLIVGHALPGIVAWLYQHPASDDGRETPE